MGQGPVNGQFIDLLNTGVFIEHHNAIAGISRHFRAAVIGAENLIYPKCGILYGIGPKYTYWQRVPNYFHHSAIELAFIHGGASLCTIQRFVSTCKELFYNTPLGSVFNSIAKNLLPYNSEERKVVELYLFNILFTYPCQYISIHNAVVLVGRILCNTPGAIIPPYPYRNQITFRYWPLVITRLLLADGSSMNWLAVHMIEILENNQVRIRYTKEEFTDLLNVIYKHYYDAFTRLFETDIDALGIAVWTNNTEFTFHIHIIQGWWTEYKNKFDTVMTDSSSDEDYFAIDDDLQPFAEMF